MALQVTQMQKIEINSILFHNIINLRRNFGFLMINAEKIKISKAREFPFFSPFDLMAMFDIRSWPESKTAQLYLLDACCIVKKCK